MIKPVRLQRSRAKGAHLVSPNGLEIVYVGRPSIWGNPYTTSPAGVDLFERWLLEGWSGMQYSRWQDGAWRDSSTRREEILRRLPELRGKNLSCWCPLDQACHGDTLLRIANEERENDGQSAMSAVRLRGIQG